MKSGQLLDPSRLAVGRARHKGLVASTYSPKSE
jgi:hypothetical protein